jgi:hypothetical protein
MIGSKRHSEYLPHCAFSGSWGGFGNLADLGLGTAVMTVVRSFSKAIWRESWCLFAKRRVIIWRPLH